MAKPHSAGNFNGSSVLSNAGHRMHVFQLDIEVLESVQTADCPVERGDPVKLASAISFVLDETKEYPTTTPDFKEPPEEADTYPTTWLLAWDIKVTSKNALCRAIELRRKLEYDTEVLLGSADYPDLVANVQNVWITSGSYSDAGIQVSGFVNAGQGGRSDEKISILKSTVMGAAGSDGSAIRFGPVDGKGSVGQNAVSANGGSGISVVRGNGVDAVTIENNSVEGAAIAIKADSAIDKAYFKSNVLVGDPNIYDVGINTSAAENIYRSNLYSNFGCDVIDDQLDSEQH